MVCRGCKLCWGGDFPVSLLWVNSMHLSFASNPYYSTTTRKIHHPPWLLNSCNFSSELDKKWATTRAHKTRQLCASCDKFLLGAFNHRWIWRCLESLDWSSVQKSDVGMSGPTELLQKPEPQAESSRALQWRRQQGCHTQWGSRRALRLMTQLNAFVPLTVFMPHILHTNPNTQKEDRNNQMPLIQASQFDDTSDWMPLTPITSQKETKFSSIFMSLTLLCLMAFLARQFGN